MRKKVTAVELTYKNAIGGYEPILKIQVFLFQIVIPTLQTNSWPKSLTSHIFNIENSDMEVMSRIISIATLRAKHCIWFHTFQHRTIRKAILSSTITMIKR